jgi:hypothetical protein
MLLTKSLAVIVTPLFDPATERRCALLMVMAEQAREAGANHFKEQRG